MSHSFVAHTFGGASSAHNSSEWDGIVLSDARALRARHVATHTARNGPVLLRHPQYAPSRGALFCPRAFECDVCPNGGGSRVWMHGPSLFGETVSVRVSGFHSHFFVLWPTGREDKTAAASFVNALNHACVVALLQTPKHEKGRRFGATEAAVAGKKAQPIVSWSFDRGTPVKSAGQGAGFLGPENDKRTFLRVNVYSPQLVRVARAILECAGDPLAGSELVQGTALDVARGASVWLGRGNEGDGAGEEDLVAGKGVDVFDGKVIRKTHTARKIEEAAKLCISPFTAGTSRALRRDAEEARYPDRTGAAAKDKGERKFILRDWKGVTGNANPDAGFLDAQAWKERAAREECAANAACEVALAPSADLCSGFPATIFRPAGGPSGGDDEVERCFVGYEVYDAELDFELRFATECGFSPEQWVFLSFAGHETSGARDVTAVAWQEAARETDAAHEFHVSNALALQPCKDLAELPPPQLCVSADGEMEPTVDGKFPKPANDRVLQMSAVCFDPVGDPQCLDLERAVASRCFMLGTVPGNDTEHALRGAQGTVCFCFDDELQMLRAFSAWLRTLQGEMFTGYNVESFDAWYVVERTKALARQGNLARSQGVVAWSRKRNRAGVRMVEKVFKTVAAGRHEFREAKCGEFFVFDLLQAFKRDNGIKLRNYSLDSVAALFLGDQKEDVAYSRIREMQETARGRAELARYCVKDSLLPARIIGKRQLVLEMVELCRYTGVTIDMLNRRGQQIRGKACLHREARWQEGERVFFYSRTRAEKEQAAQSDDSYEGAVVLPPHRGFHSHPVVVLDFASLYPSIIVTNNMCPTTLLPYNGRERAQRLRKLALPWGVDTWSPNKTLAPDQDGVCFVRSHVREGIVPRVLRRLLGLRAEIKKRLKKAKAQHEGDPAFASLLAVLDKQQLAVKLICNSMYGLFGTHTSFWECIPLASGVTEEGRRVILRTKQFIEETYTVRNGHAFNAVVVYGDTDSVFVKLVPAKPGQGEPEPISVQEAAKIGLAMAGAATKMLRDEGGNRPEDIMRLEFEKVFSRLLMLQKKRYAGLKWELSKDGVTLLPPNGVSSSGMEKARRDPCRFVSQGVGDLLEHLLNAQGKDMTPQECLEAGREYVHERMLRPIVQGTVDFWSVMQSNQLRKTVAEYRSTGGTPPVHVVLAEKLRKRHGDGAPQVPKPGERVQYVVVEDLHEDNKKASCGEDPLHAWKHRMRLNLPYYTDSVLCKPLVRIFGPLLVPDGARGMAPTEKACDDIVEKRVSQFLFDSFVGRKRLRTQAPQEEHEGERKRQKGRSAFFGTVLRCALCNVPLGRTEPAALGQELACERCTEKRKIELQAKRDEETAQFAGLKGERDEIWATCQTCISGCEKGDVPPVPSDIEDLTGKISCENTSCKTLWKRLRNDRLFAEAVTRNT